MSDGKTLSKRVAPWPDYAGNPILEDDVIRHPNSGQLGLVVYVVYVEDGDYDGDHWRVNYGDGFLSRLGLQIDDKDQAVVCKNITKENFEFLLSQCPSTGKLFLENGKITLQYSFECH